VFDGVRLGAVGRCGRGLEAPFSPSEVPDSPLVLPTLDRGTPYEFQELWPVAKPEVEVGVSALPDVY
jgi:hypothetical protein